MASWLGLGSGGGPSEEEKQELVEQLKGRFAGEDADEASCRRFLFTRSWKLDGAAVMLQNHVKWRAENLPVTLEEVKPTLDERKVVMLGNGESGRPVFMLNFLQLMEVDWKAPGEMERHIRAAVYCAETSVAAMPPGVETWIAIVNCTGIRAPPQAYMQEYVKVMQANYPERAHKIVMYPIPRFIVSVAQSFMLMIPEKTRDKVSFVSNPEGICEACGLTKEQLPKEMLCPADMDVLKGASAVEVGAGKATVHRHELRAGEALKWSFRVLDHNVNFELRFVAVSSSGEPCSPASPASGSSGAGAGYTLAKLEKVNESEGDFTAEQDGALEFNFDNTFSYMRGKSVVVSCTPAASSN